MTIGIGGAYIVLYGFSTSCKRVIHVTVHYFVKLKDIILRDRDSVKAVMDNVQRIAVSRYFLFITIFRCCFFVDNLTDTGICRDNALNGV